MVYFFFCISEDQIKHLASIYYFIGNWNDDNCNDQLGFVCKKKNGTYIPKTIPPSQPVPGYCPKGYVGAGITTANVRCKVVNGQILLILVY